MVKKKGITLIELIITMSILSIALSSIYSFFFTNYKTLNSVNTDLEVQSQGEKAINFMVDNIIEGYKIIETKPYINSTVETEISRLVLEKKDSENNTYYSIFEFENGKLYFKDDSSKDLIINEDGNAICTGITSLKVTLIPASLDSQNGDGLRIKINLQSGKIQKEFINEVYLRNKE